MQVKFGVQIPQEDLTYEEIRHFFMTLEKLDFHSAFVYDHFHPIWSPHDASVLENWVLLSALAVETSAIKIGTLVNCNSYRYPNVLAKMVASLDVISGGRLEFMIGAGWYEAEYKGYGIPFPRAKIRVEQLKEAIQVIKLMWTEHKAHFKGKYYQLKGAISYPKPLQKPYPRIWVGGGGERYTLRAVAEVGEGTNFFGTVGDFERKLGLLRKYCEEAGRGYASIAKSWAGDVIVGTSEGEVQHGLKKLKAKRLDAGEKVSLEELKRRGLIGTPSRLINKIEEYLKLGVDYFVVIPPDLKDTKMTKLFAERIIAAFK